MPDHLPLIPPSCEIMGNMLYICSRALGIYAFSRYFVSLLRLWERIGRVGFSRARCGGECFHGSLWIFKCWTQHFYLISSVSPFVYLFPLSLLATSPLASHKTRIQGTDRSYNGDPVRVCHSRINVMVRRPVFECIGFFLASVCHPLLDSKLPRHLIAR